MTPAKHVLLATTLFAGFSALAPQIANAATTLPTTQRLTSGDGGGGGGEIIATNAAGAVLAAGQGAQDQTTPDQTKKPDKSDSTVKEVVVTGSRFKRTEYNSAAPVQVLSADTAKAQGVSTTMDLLMTSTLVAGNSQQNNELTGYLTTGGPGVNTIALRGLGAQRTLILIDGERIGPAGVTGTVGPIDINTIPFAAVDHVEILKDGASSIYGSDAVAGVINIITKKNIDGGIINASTDFTQAGGGARYDVNAAWGKVYPRGYWSLSVDYSEQDVLRASQRSATSCASDYLDAVGGGRVDYSNLNGNGYKCFNQEADDIITGNNQFLIYPQKGVTYPADAQGNPYGLILQTQPGSPDTYPYALYNTQQYQHSSTISPDTTYSAIFKFGRDLTDSLQVWGDLLYNRRQSVQDGYQYLFPFVPSDNPANTLPALGGVLPVIARPLDMNQDVDYIDVRGGLRGKFTDTLPVIGGWDWDAYASFSSSFGRYGENVMYNDRINAVTESGIACDQSAITISAKEKGGSCSLVPNGVPFLNPAELAAQWTPAEKEFLFGYEYGITTYQEQDFEATMKGKLLTLPAGPLQAVLGVDERSYSINDTPGVDMRNQNLWGLTTSGITKGSDAVREVFGEFDVPLIKGVPLIRSFDLQGSVRYTDYDSYGGGTTYRVGAVWNVIPGVTFRGTHGTSYRAPELYELYLANQTGFQGQLTTNPCVNWGANPNANLQKNCAAWGFASNYNGNGSSVEVTTGGGKGHLAAETSESTVLGIVLTPSFAPVKISFEYTNMLISNEVATFGAQNIAYQCAISPNMSSPFCSLINVGAPAPGQPVQLNSVDDNYENISAQKLHAWDLTIDAWHNIGDNKFAFRGTATWQTLNEQQVFTGFPGINYSGTTFAYEGPQFVSFLNFSWTRHNWTALWSTNMIGHGSDLKGQFLGGSVFDQAYNQVVTEKNYTEFVAYHTVSLQWTLPNQLSVIGGVRNVFDTGAPNVSTGEFRTGTAALNAYTDGYLGRQFFLNVSKKF